MIHLHDINVHFGSRILFDSISCTIMPHQKIGLVGRNGSGKTTLLTIIAQRMAPDSGTVAMPNDFRCAFMPQDVVLLSEKTVLNEALAAFGQLADAHQESITIEPLLHNNALSASEHTALIERYAHAQQVLQDFNYEQTIVHIKQVLDGLGFHESQLNNPVNSLSVGWKMRLLLAQLLLQKADFYLFDEPTNHLDLQAKDWFLSFLKDANFGFILVSHDQYFLDNACTSIFALSAGHLKTYNGNYSSYLIQSEQERVILEKKYNEQQKYIKKQTATIDRFRAKASKASVVQSMIKALEKIEPIVIEHDPKSINISLPDAPHTGKIILEVQHLRFGFAQEKPLFHDVTFQILRNQRVALVAPNGTGKSTLLQVIMGKLQPQDGTIILGHQVLPAFFEQDQNRSLNPNNTLLTEVEQSCTTSEARSKVRNLLGSFLFSGDDVFKHISVLSGGEKNRVAMAKILLQTTNFLILDEPTNHLDLQSKEILLLALKQYKGTILFVSHDHYFLNGLATHILTLTQNGITLFPGNYESYKYHEKQYKNQSEIDICRQQPEKVVKAPSSNKIAYERRKQLQQIEMKIGRLENNLHQQAELLPTLDYHSSSYKETELLIKSIEIQIAELTAQWEALMRQA